MKTKELENDEIRSTVRQVYGKAASEDAGCGCAPTCCGRAANDGAPRRDADAISQSLGYSKEEAAAVPGGANLGLGCGNPQAIAALRPGETVLDLGSGAGFDSFLAARAVGVSGRVIGVDMTPEMVSKARRNQVAGGYTHVEFRLGEIENLPVSDGLVDVILSNCVINLSPDKQRVFHEAFRVLKPGGRLAIADVVAVAEIPRQLSADPELHAACMAGASTIDALALWLARAGFTHIRIREKEGGREIVGGWLPGRGVEEFLASAIIEAVKPVQST